MTIAAMQVFVSRHVAPVWGTPAKLIRTRGFLKGPWAMVFLDDADQPGALAYPDLTPDGLPQRRVATGDRAGGAARLTGMAGVGP